MASGLRRIKETENYQQTIELWARNIRASQYSFIETESLSMTRSKCDVDKGKFHKNQIIQVGQNRNFIKQYFSSRYLSSSNSL